MDITQDLVLQCKSFSELTRKLGRNPHNRITHQLRKHLTEKNISFSHFTKNGSTPIIRPSKICPVCNTKFEVKLRNDPNQITCSYSCSNVYFADRRSKPKNWKNYRTICWKYHVKKCIVCGEDKIVEVHHMDENNKNNDPKNLVPLCPTHHKYWHSRHRDLVRPQVEAFVFKNIKS
jgi:hypothetical protein